MDSQGGRSAPTPDEIASAAGPLLIGVLMTWLLMGVYAMQAHFYFMTYNDPAFICALVMIISALEVAQWILSTLHAWYYLITIWGDFSGFFIVPREALFLVLLCAITSMIVQSFYAWRIWTMAYDAWLLRVIAVFIEGVSLMQGSSAIAAAAFVLMNRTEAEVARRHLFVDNWLIGSLVTDTLISLCMLRILFKARDNTPRESTKQVLNQLIINTVKTGSATTIVAAVTFALFDSLRDRNYYGATFPFLQKLYSISLLTYLNARPRGGASGADESVELNFSDIIIQTTTDATSGGASYTEEAVTRGAHPRSLRVIPDKFRSSILKTFSWGSSADP
ncbi:hypothetical protein DFH09DRAFT_1151147 [Mycena vulgaris]|nr:hypothetical protein DFH09DRAFT_1151147 [Mycena vulgaris]